MRRGRPNSNDTIEPDDPQLPNSTKVTPVSKAKKPRKAGTTDVERLLIIEWLKNDNHKYFKVLTNQQQLSNVESGKMISKEAAFRNLAEFINKQTKKSADDQWDGSGAKKRYNKYIDDYKSTLAKKNSTGFGTKAMDAGKSISTLLNESCPYFDLLDTLFGARENIQPSVQTTPSSIRFIDLAPVDIEDEDECVQNDLNYRQIDGIELENELVVDVGLDSSIDGSNSIATQFENELISTSSLSQDNSPITFTKIRSNEKKLSHKMKKWSPTKPVSSHKLNWDAFYHSRDEERRSHREFAEKKLAFQKEELDAMLQRPELEHQRRLKENEQLHLFKMEAMQKQSKLDIIKLLTIGLNEKMDKKDLLELIEKANLGEF